MIDHSSDPPATQESGFSGPLESGLRHPLLVLLPILILLGAAAGLGLARKPSYTSTARINVGRTNVPAFTLQGVTQGNATLAASYARAIDATPVVVPAARAAGTTPARASSDLSATPVSGTTLIEVDADGANAHAAINLANAGSRALIAYVAKGQQNDLSTILTRQYKASSLQEVGTRRRYLALQAAKAPSARLDQARIDYELAFLRTSSLRDQLKVAVADVGDLNQLQLLVTATSAKSDRTSKLEQLLLIGGAGGLVLGLAFAVVLDFRRQRRRTE